MACMQCSQDLLEGFPCGLRIVFFVSPFCFESLKIPGTEQTYISRLGHLVSHMYMKWRCRNRCTFSLGRCKCTSLIIESLTCKLNSSTPALASNFGISYHSPTLYAGIVGGLPTKDQTDPGCTQQFGQFDCSQRALHPDKIRPNNHKNPTSCLPRTPSSKNLHFTNEPHVWVLLRSQSVCLPGT